MNKKQKIALIAIMVVILGMLVYPPFHLRGKGGLIASAGYGWIFDPPSEKFYISPTVDIGLLVIQWLGVLIAGGILWLILRTSPPPESPS